MKVVIFAGGLGTRLSEETSMRPKPMVEIGGKPILWHIMKIYESYGFNDFIICCGYKGYMIKEYFMNYFMHNSDVTIDLKNNKTTVHQTNSEAFTVTLVDTGLHTLTAGRLQRVKHHLEEDESFMLTYGDGVSNVDLLALYDFHKQHGKLATMTSIQPPGRFGSLVINESNVVTKFAEKPKGDGGWINGGFFILNRKVLDYLPENSDAVAWEDIPLETLAKDEQLVAYRHTGFWKCMDHLRDKVALESTWNSQKAPWKIWS